MPVDTLRVETETAPEASAPAFSAPAFLRDREAAFSRWGTVAALAVLLLVSLWLRTRGMHASYWIDEGLSVGIASHPFSHIPALMRQDGSPPLYYMLLHVWMSLRGRGEVATHELSLIFGLLTVPAAYWAGKSLFDRRAGLFCAVIATGIPYLNAYSHETRMYALLALLALVACASFVEVFVLRRRRYLPLFVISLAAALYTHNWAVFLAVAAAVAFLLCVRERPLERRALWRDGLIALGGVAILYAPWLPTVFYQSRHTGAPWDLPPVVWSLSQGLYSLVGGRGAAAALLLGGGTGLVALRGVRDAKGSRTLLAVTCLLVLGFGTLLVAWLYSKLTPAWATRYFAVVVAPLIIVFGLGLARGGRLAIVALALTCCWWVLDPVPASRSSKSNVAAVAAALRPYLGSDPLVLSTQPEQVPTIAYYLPAARRFGTPIGRVPDPHIVDWRNALERLHRSSIRRVLIPMLRSLTPGQRVVLITPVRFQKSPLWLDLIWRYSREWSRFLERDSALRPLASSAASWSSAGVPVRATVYLSRRGG